MQHAEKLKVFLAVFAAALITTVIVGDEVRGFVDGLVVGFTDER